MSRRQEIADDWARRQAEQIEANRQEVEANRLEAQRQVEERRREDIRALLVTDLRLHGLREVDAHRVASAIVAGSIRHLSIDYSEASE